MVYAMFGFLASWLSAILFAGIAMSNPKNKDILLVGDSLAVGLSAPMKALGKRDDVHVHDEAKVGTTASYWVPRLPSILRARRPRVLAVSLGTNDAAIADRKLASEALRGICKVAEELDVRLVWIAPPSLPARLTGAATVRATIDDCAPVVLDISEGIERAPDGIHATGKGYATWALRLWAPLLLVKGLDPR